MRDADTGNEVLESTPAYAEQQASKEMRFQCSKRRVYVDKSLLFEGQFCRHQEHEIEGVEWGSNRQEMANRMH